MMYIYFALLASFYPPFGGLAFRKKPPIDEMTSSRELPLANDLISLKVEGV